MKRIISAILFVTVLLTLVCPVFARDSYHILVNESLQEPRSAEDFTLSTTSKRRAQDDNLLIPGPYISQKGVQKGNHMFLQFISLQTGKAGQYGCILIYPGRGTSGEPIHTDYKAFGTNEGYFTMDFKWNCQEQPVGTYTVVSVTAEAKGNELVPIAGTAFSEYVHITETAVTIWNYFPEDWETGKRLGSIDMAVDEVKLVAWERSPTPSSPGGTMEISAPKNLVDVKFAGGLFIITPKKCGSGWLNLRYNYGQYAFPINVCMTNKGHNYTESVVARENTLYGQGVNVHYCADCEQIIRETTYSKSEDFKRFKDLDVGAWYYEYVRDAFYENLFKGISFYEFKPNETMTRAMLVTVLWRYAGQPDAQGASFTDVNPREWYGKAVAWASEQGIVNGVGKGKFDPNGEVTREQLATILFRYGKMLDLDLTAHQELVEFEDHALVQSWSHDALEWAVGYGLITGSSQGEKLYLLPQDGATRAQVSAILVRFLEKLRALDNQPATLDLANAVDSGSFTAKGGVVEWAYDKEGTLRITGSGEPTVPDVRTLGEGYAWSAYGEEIKRIEIFAPVTNIDEAAFSNYSALESVWMKDTVVELRKRAFHHCTALVQVELSQNLLYVGREAFKDCIRLSDIALPQGLNILDYKAFENCTSLKEMVLPDSLVVEYAGTGVDKSGAINAYIFAGCTSLERVVLPVALQTLPDGIFENCTSLTEVVFPLCLSNLGLGAFLGCESLETVVLPYGLKTIVLGSFTGCTSLKEVYILDPNAQIYEIPNYDDFPFEELPFGDPAKVTVYGFTGTEMENTLKTYGYTFVDITPYL